MRKAGRGRSEREGRVGGRGQRNTCRSQQSVIGGNAAQYRNLRGLPNGKLMRARILGLRIAVVAMARRLRRGARIDATGRDTLHFGRNQRDKDQRQRKPDRKCRPRHRHAIDFRVSCRPMRAEVLKQNYSAAVPLPPNTIFEFEPPTRISTSFGLSPARSMRTAVLS
jgi:hypothetical protein